MDNKDDQLYEEEKLAKLKDIKKQLENSAIIPIPRMPEKFKAEIVNEITAKIIDRVELDDTPFKELSESLRAQTELLVKSITQTLLDMPSAPDKIEVTNIADAKANEISVNNLGGLENTITELAKAVMASQPIVNIEKQEIRWPKLAKEAIPVRLSDGQSFYNAVFAAVSAANASPKIEHVAINQSGAGTDVLVAGVAGSRIRVVSYVLVLGGAGTVQFTGSGALTGAMSLGANSGISANGSADLPLMKTDVGQSLSIVSTSNPAKGHLSYHIN